jgi:hypothetical protein
MRTKLLALVVCLPLFTPIYADEEQEDVSSNQEETVSTECQDFRDDGEINYSILEKGEADLAVGAKNGVANSFYLGMSPKFAELPIQTQRSLIAKVTKETYDGVRYYLYEDGQLNRVELK